LKQLAIALSQASAIALWLFWIKGIYILAQGAFEEKRCFQKQVHQCHSP
jgi:hypothetical protein